MTKINSRISQFYNKSVEERLEIISEMTGMDEKDKEVISFSKGLSPDIAEYMIENVIGGFQLPLGIATNFKINGKNYLIPMAVEEPSVVAAASHMAKLTRDSGGFETSYSGSVMIAQIHVIDIADPFGAKLALYKRRDELLSLANSCDATLVSLGGGAKDIEVRVLDHPQEDPVLAIHLIVNVLDAMGANAVNSMAERLAPLVESITKGKVLLRILSNFAEYRIVRVRTQVPVEQLRTEDFTGDEVADRMVKANFIAVIDPYRATTHNKGIMNGIDPVVLATGNDWRAIEAGAHAYATRTGVYRSLTNWERNEVGDLVGTLEIPMAVGIVGGATKTHPAAQLSLKIMDVNSAEELAQVIGAVGLAQNMAALKALSTEGIQRGHMELHARNIALQAGATTDVIDQIAEDMVQEKNVSIDKAKELLLKMNK